MGLTKDQKHAFAILSSGANVFLTGEAGTGKSYLLQEFIADNADKKILVTAPTGIAAIEIGGATLHRTFRIPVGDLAKIHRGPRRVSKVVEAADILIIDEISMCRLDVFEYVLAAVKMANHKRKDRGDIQIILVGDFLQLPPILRKDELPLYRELHGHASVFPFFSPLWDSFSFQTVILREVVRQQGDLDLLDNLNRARRGDASCIPYFNRFVTEAEAVDEEAIHICPTNKKAGEINTKKTRALPGPSVVYEGYTEGEVQPSDKPTDEKIELREGARVMLLVNNPTEGYSNGSMGTCLEMGEDSLVVELDSGRVIEVAPYEWSVHRYASSTKKNKETGKEETTIELRRIGLFVQLPIKVAFAITTHKSQGQTFDRVVINPYAWDSGQLYVALSRVRSSSGLQLSAPILSRYLIADGQVLDFYEIYPQKEEAAAPTSYDLQLAAMYFPKLYEGILHEVVQSLLHNDKERFLEIARRVWATEE